MDETKQAAGGGAFLLREGGSVALPESLALSSVEARRAVAALIRHGVPPVALALERGDVAAWKGVLGSATEEGHLAGPLVEPLAAMAAWQAMGAHAALLGAMRGHASASTLISWLGGREHRPGGKLLSCAWLDEGGRWQWDTPLCDAVATEHGTFRLSGHKALMPQGELADVLVVLAQVGGEPTWFLVDVASDGVLMEGDRLKLEGALGERLGAGSEVTTQLIAADRLRLAAGTVGVLQTALVDAKGRRSWSPAREVLAHVSALSFALESMVYRTAGLLEVRQGDRRSDAEAQRAALHEYDVETLACSLFASEALSVGLDALLELSDVTSLMREQARWRLSLPPLAVSRQLIPTRLVERAIEGRLPLFDFAHSVDEELSRMRPLRPRVLDDLASEALLCDSIRRLAVYSLNAVAARFGQDIERHPLALGPIAELVVDTYALDSSVARARQTGLAPHRVAQVQLLGVYFQRRAMSLARKALLSCADEGAIEAHLTKIRTLASPTAHDPIECVERAVEST